MQQPLRFFAPISPFDSSASKPLIHNAMDAPCSASLPAPLDDYARTMLQYTQAQIWTLVGLDKHNGTSNSDYDNTPASDVLLHQGPGPPNIAKAQKAGQHT